MVLDGAEHPLMAHGISDRRAGGSGDMWWGILPLPAVEEPVEVPLTLHAELDAGARTDAQLATLRLVPALDAEPVTAPARNGDSTRPPGQTTP